MAKLDNYDGSVQLIAGITQKGGGDFPLIEANAIQTQEDGTRLDYELANIEEEVDSIKTILPKDDDGNLIDVASQDNLSTLESSVDDISNRLPKDNSTDEPIPIASQQYVGEQIALAQLEGAGVDTSNFVVQSELDEVYGSLVKETTGANKFNKDTASPKYTIGSSGNIVSSANFCTSDFIYCFGESVFSCYVAFNCYCFYDENKNPLDGRIVATQRYNVSIPEGAYYLRVSTNYSEDPTSSYYNSIENQMIVFADTQPTVYEPYENYKQLRTDVEITLDNITDDIKTFFVNTENFETFSEEMKNTFLGEKSESLNRYNGDTDVHGYSLDTAGKLVAVDGRVTSDFIPCYGETVFSCANSILGNYYFYDEDKNFISSHAPASRNGLPIPEGVHYLRIITNEANAPTQMVIFAETSVGIPYESYSIKTALHPDIIVTEQNLEAVKHLLPNTFNLHTELFNGCTIKLIGDSITHGVGGTGFTNDAENGELIMSVGSNSFYTNPNGYCWANLLKSYLEEKFSGVTVHANGTRGESYHTFQLNSFSRLKQLVTASDDTDIVIMMFGTNDRNYCTDVSDMITKASAVIEYITKTCGKKLILMTSIPASVANETGESVKFHMEDVANANKYLAEKYQLPFINIYTEFLKRVTAKGEEINTYLSDGLHPNDNGYTLMFEIIAENLGIAFEQSDNEGSTEETTFVDVDLVYDGQVQNYTNLVDLDSTDWLTNYGVILNSDTKKYEVIENTDHIVTNFIPCQPGDIVRVCGLKGSTSTNGGTFRIVAYDSNESDASPLYAFSFCKTYEQVNIAGISELLDEVELSNEVYSYKLWQIRTSSGATSEYSSSSSAVYFRVSGIPTNGVENIVITVNDPIYEYTANTKYTLNENVHVPLAEENSERLNIVEEELNDNKMQVEILLPRKAVAVVGHEFNIYTENVLFGNRDFLKDYDIVWQLRDKTTGDRITTIPCFSYSDCWRITPTKEHIGVYTLALTIREIAPLNKTVTNLKVIAEKVLDLHIIEDTTFDASNPKKVLFIGDSMTFASIYPAEIQYNLSSGGIVSLGTFGRSVKFDKEENGIGKGEILAIGNIGSFGEGVICENIYHEGRNSWASWNYARDKTFRDRDNPFYNEQKALPEDYQNSEFYKIFGAPSLFDFQYYIDTYMTEYDDEGNVIVTTPDIICLNLGTNGIGADSWSVCGLKAMIESIREYDADVPIIISLIAPTIGQDYWGYKVGSSQHTGTAKYQHALYGKMINSYIKNFDGIESNVDVSEIYFCLDTHNDFPTDEMPVSSRNPTLIARQTDGHPSKYGYLKMADTYYANLLYHLTKSNSESEQE